MEWKKLKQCIQSIKPRKFEEFIATLLGSLLKTHFEVAKSGYQPIGDAINAERTIVMQAKRYADKTDLKRKEILGDIREAYSHPEAPNLQTYVLAASRAIRSKILLKGLDAAEEETGLDIVTLELTDDLSDLGALCVTFWENIHHFFPPSNIDRQFTDWVERMKTEQGIRKKIRKLRLKLKHCTQTQNRVQKKVEKCFRIRFNSIDLPEEIVSPVESEIANWWMNPDQPFYLEGKEESPKLSLAAKWVSSTCENKDIIPFWLDSNCWNNCSSMDDLFLACLKTIPAYQDEKKLTKLKRKISEVWCLPILIILNDINTLESIKVAERILNDYLDQSVKAKSKWGNRVRLLLITQLFRDYQNTKGDLWRKCRHIRVETPSNLEGQQLTDLPKSLRSIAKIPRYSQRYTELRDEFSSFDDVTKEMVLWADLLEKIRHAEPCVRDQFGWNQSENAQEILAKLAEQRRWVDVDTATQFSAQLLKKCFSNYSETRQDLEEQRIVLGVDDAHVKVNQDHVVLGWALYLSSLFDYQNLTTIKDFAGRLHRELGPIPSEDPRTEALFVALQISAIFPRISQKSLSQKRAALILIFARFNNHNPQLTDERLSFWSEQDTDAYLRAVESELEHSNPPNYEDALITPLAKTWFHKRGQIECLTSYLTEWLLPTCADDISENRVYTHVTGQPFPRKTVDVQLHLLDAALSILSQRPEHQFLKTLARCYVILLNSADFDNNLGRQTQFFEKIGKLMRWGYTEAVLDDLCVLAEQAQHDQVLLRGICGLAEHLNKVHLPEMLQRPLSKKESDARAFVEQHNRRFKSIINRIRDKEKLLIGDSPTANVEGNYHGLGYLAVRTDLPCLTEHDKVEIKKLLHHISANAALGAGRSASLEDFCIENLMPWVARYDPESYAELACNLKFNALNQKWAQFKLRSIQGLIFKLEDCKKITEAILGMKERLAHGKDFYPDVEWLTSLLTESLLFSASEDMLTDWFEFLAAHEPLRISICYEPLPNLLEIT